MISRCVVKRGEYQDSLRLMEMYTAARTLPGVIEAACVMATELNKDLLRTRGLLPQDVAAGPEDLLIILQGEDSAALDTALRVMDDSLSTRAAVPADSLTQSDSSAPRSLDRALGRLAGANVALISVPGAYAAAEAARALQRGLHVHLFSDNVTIEDELALKRLAHERELLLMGPDCGTAILNGAPLGFANIVRRGPVGIVGASGTGIQQATVLLDRLGVGISHAIGVGGRDLSAAVGGLMTLDALDMLEQDAATGCILLISKPPAAETLGQVLDRVRTSNKPVVVCFLGADPAALAGVEYGATIEDAVLLAAGHVGAPTDPDDRYTESSMVEAERRRLQPTQRYVRGLYVGGTLADEAMLILSSVLGPINSNVPLPGRGTRLLNAAESLGNAVVDLGDDEFTQGRPHPMIDPLLRNERISREARDREVAVLLCDVVLGLGSHPDPAGVLANALRRVRSQVDSGAEHPFPAVVASVCGTPGDPQQLDRQEQVLREAGVRVMRSNAKAARVAAAIASSYREVLS